MDDILLFIPGDPRPWGTHGALLPPPPRPPVNPRRSLVKQRRPPATPRQPRIRGLPLSTIRRVWAVVSRDPQTPVREIAQELRIGATTILAALNVLRDAGYIEFKARSTRTRKVIVPFRELP